MDATSDDIRLKVKPLLVQYQTALGYSGAHRNDRRALFEGLHREAARTGIPYPEGSRSWSCFQAGAHYGYFCYINLPIEIRIYAAIFTWFAILLDDEACSDPDEWHQFVPRFLAGGEDRHTNDLAREWDRWLRLSYQLYSPQIANFIVTASLDFVNASALEGSDGPKIVRTKGGESWASYIRDKNGMAEAYAYMTFPKTVCPDAYRYVQCVGDMNRWLCLTNDVFSFYKEQVAMETDTYVHCRASYEGICVYEMLKKTVEECGDLHRRIALALEGQEPYAQYWKDHVLGYVSFHTCSERYKLRDLGLAESPA